MTARRRADSLGDPSPPAAAIPAGLLPAAAAACTFTQFTLSALAPQLVTGLGLGARTFGLAFSAMFAVGALMSVPAGSLTTTIGARPALTLGVALTATGVGTLAATAVSGWLVVTVLCGGVAMSLANPATNLAISQYVADSRRGRVAGLTQAGIQGGALAAGLLAPLAVVVGWRVVLGGVAVACVLLLAGIQRQVPASGVAPRVVAGSRLPPSVPAVAFYAAGMGAVGGLVFAYLALSAHVEHGMGQGTAGLLTAVFGAGGLVARIVYGRVSLVRTHAWRVLALLGAGATATMVGLSFVPTGHGAWLWPLAAVFGVTGVAWPAVATIVMLDRVAATDVARASGRFATGFYAGLLLGPLAASAVIAEGATDFRAVWMLAAGAAGLATVTAAAASTRPTRVQGA